MVTDTYSLPSGQGLYTVHQRIGHTSVRCILQPYIDPLCPITTPFDVISNQIKTKHGSVGVGFGETINRQENHFTLFAKDLKYKNILDRKLHNIQEYYGLIGYSNELNLFLSDVQEMLKIVRIEKTKHKGDLIFEGAQGILLDQKFGFFPYVTRSNTTSKNAISLIDKYCQPEIYLVTRAYQTRHGKGPMTNENVPIKLVNNEKETNILNKWQGEFRVAPLDKELINYAIECEELISDLPKNIIMTCCDQVEIIPGIDTPYQVIYNSSPEGNFIKTLV
jgi:adenylosuccinate synthase